MNKNLTIQVSDPCQEPWGEMTPNSQGKHCSSCAKTVVDFTKMTDRELLHWWNSKESATSTCGRFREDQLNRSLSIPPVPKVSLLRKMAAVATTLVLATSGLAAQSQISPDHFLLNGKVFGSDKSEELIGANIAVYQDEKLITGTTTDFDGAYQLHLNKALNGENLKIEISYIGYQSKSQEIDLQTPNIDFILNESAEILGDVIVGTTAISRKKVKVASKPVLTGEVLDRNSKEKLKGANLSIIDGKGNFFKGTSTDDKGRFKMDLSKLSNPKDYFVEVSYVGYETEVFPLSEVKINRKQKFKLSIGLDLPTVVVTCESKYINSKVVMGGVRTKRKESFKNEDSRHEKALGIRLDKDNFICFPNPFYSSTTLKFDWSKSEYMFLRLTSMEGRMVFEKRILTVAGENKFQIRTDDLGLGAGMYLVHLESLEGVIISLPLIKVDHGF